MKSILVKTGMVAGGLGLYVLISGLTGFCPMCTTAVNGAATAMGFNGQAAAGQADAGSERAEQAGDGARGGASEDDFERRRRGGAVDIAREYNVHDPRIPLDEVHELLPRDAIPALTDPKLEPASKANWLNPDDRILEVQVGDESVGVALRILDRHEVANMTIDGQPVAATYCPLCDSATVISRVVEHETSDGEVKRETLEFGVSGALYNSNVLMYDRTHKGLWSQLAMKAVTGPMAGTALKHLPARVVSFREFQRHNPDGMVVSNDTGFARQYSSSPYKGYFETDRLIVPVRSFGDELPRKTLGVGVAAGDQAWFIPERAIGDGYSLETEFGEVRISTGEAGIVVEKAPEDVRTAQTFYYAWSAFYPKAHVIED